MTSTDRMGGFIDVRIIETKHIAGFRVTGGCVSITLKENWEFSGISAKKGGISPSVTDTHEKSGIIYQVNLTISAKKSTGIKFIPFNKYIAVCTNPMQEQIVFGTPEYPLTGSCVPILSDRADGAVGETIRFTGKQTTPPLILVS